MKEYDLEERALDFATEVRIFAFASNYNSFPDNDLRQVIRSSGSIGANYIESNEGISRRDSIYRIKICKKEAKETVYRLYLLEVDQTVNHLTRLELAKEAHELMLIFASMLRNINSAKI